MKSLVAVVLSAGLLMGLYGIAFGCPASGFTYYAVQIPEGVDIVIDGDLSDWFWFPDAATITLAEAGYAHVCEDAADGCDPRPEDFD